MITTDSALLRFALIVMVAVEMVPDILQAQMQQVTILASGPPLIDPIGIAISPDEVMLLIADYSSNCRSNTMIWRSPSGRAPILAAC